jgi:cell wall assembly regulator SMI1
MPFRKYGQIINFFSQLINDPVISQELPDLVKEIETTLAESQIVIPTRPNSAIQRQNTGSSRRSSR